MLKTSSVGLPDRPLTSPFLAVIQEVAAKRIYLTMKHFGTDHLDIVGVSYRYIPSHWLKILDEADLC